MKIVDLFDLIHWNAQTLVEIEKKDEEKSNQVILFRLIRLNHLNFVKFEKKGKYLLNLTFFVQLDWFEPSKSSWDWKKRLIWSNQVILIDLIRLNPLNALHSLLKNRGNECISLIWLTWLIQVIWIQSKIRKKRRERLNLVNFFDLIHKIEMIESNPNKIEKLKESHFSLQLILLKRTDKSKWRRNWEKQLNLHLDTTELQLRAAREKYS